MRVSQLLRPVIIPINPQLQEIASECTQSLHELSTPLLKWLPVSTPDIKRFKVRYNNRDHNSLMSEAFKRAFDAQFVNVRERAVFVNFMQTEEDTEPFYVLPPNGYKYLYNVELNQSSNQLAETVAQITSELDADSATTLLSDIVKQSYRSSNIMEAVRTRSEVILYNIPYFYAVRASSIPYNTLTNHVSRYRNSI